MDRHDVLNDGHVAYQAVYKRQGFRSRWEYRGWIRVSSAGTAALADIWPGRRSPKPRPTQFYLGWSPSRSQGGGSGSNVNGGRIPGDQGGVIPTSKPRWSRRCSCAARVTSMISPPGAPSSTRWSTAPTPGPERPAQQGRRSRASPSARLASPAHNRPRRGAGHRHTQRRLLCCAGSSTPCHPR
jgi:hypothetical protein